MSFQSSHDVKEQVRQATDLVDLVSRSVQLRRQGKMFVGICPWHDDSRPSLQVNPERQSWKCWVCDVGGDVFSFVMKREGVDFPSALRMLAERAGITLTAGPGERFQPGSPQDKQTLYRAMAWAEQQLHGCLLDAPEAKPARAYLQDRGITRQSIEKFHLGFSPNAWQWLLDRSRSTEFSAEVLEAAGLVIKTRDNKRYYDRFRGRLIFSIRDTERRPIAFGGRVLPQLAEENSPKYVNSPETRVYVKSDHLYALDIVREAVTRSRQIAVVEGYTDVIMAHQCGLNHVVAVLGTALGERHVRLLRRFADTITLVLDGDEAGQRRTNEILELFVAEQVDLRILTLPAGLDPCDFLRREGEDAFRELLSQAVDALEHKVRVAMRGIDPLRNPDQGHRALEDILRTIAGAPQLPTATKESIHLRQQQMLARLAHLFHVEETTIRARLVELRQARRRPVRGSSPATVPERKTPLTPRERELFEILVYHVSLVPAVLRSIDAQNLTSSTSREVWELYLEADRQGLPFEFQQMLTIAEDPALKSLLVQLDEQARTKAQYALEEAEARLHGLIRSFEFERQRADQRESLAGLDSRRYDEQEELAVLEQIIQSERKRQGISAPTDG